MWSRRVDDELELVLAEPRLAPEVVALTEANRDHLSAWEAWAATPADLASTYSWLGTCLVGFAHGQQVQTYLYWRGTMVGSASLVFETVRNTAELGYWLAADATGHGLATRAGRSLMAMAFEERLVRRVEVRTSVGNLGSRAVAERLGLHHEGTLLAAYPIGDRVDDIALYGLASDA